MTEIPDLDRYLKTLAELVSKELDSRDLGVFLCEEPGYFRRSNRRNQICLTDEYLPSEEITEERIEQWAVELGCKLARPFDMTTYALELPEGVYWTNYTICNGLYIRGCVDYVLNEDMLVLRFDVLVSWNDK